MPPANGFRDHLERLVASAVVPYGYTLSIWGGGGVAIHRLGPPTVVDALLYVAGGALGFFATEVLAHGDLRPHLRPPDPPPVMPGWGAVHVIPAGTAVLGAAGVTSLVRDALAWPAAGFVVTCAYLLLSALQFTIASRAT